MKQIHVQGMMRRLPLAIVLSCVSLTMYFVGAVFLKTQDKALTQERIVAQVEHVDETLLAKFTTEEKRLQALVDSPNNTRDPFLLDEQQPAR